MKSVEDFHKSSEKGLQSQCKPCKTEVKREWIQENREKVKWNAIYTKYRLRKPDYEAMVSSQAGRCAICEEGLINPHIDHDHVSGVVRGLLCPRCNQLVGWLEQCSDLILTAQKYIQAALV